MTPPRPTRRSVVKGAAWTAPVVVVASTAPAFAASPAANVNIVPFSSPQVSGPILRFATDLQSNGSGPTTDLKGYVTVTAPSASSWGPNPTAVVTNSFGGGASTQTTWTFVGVTGTGTSRTFVFDAVQELSVNATVAFDWEINTAGGAIGPGEFVRQMVPGGNGTVTSVTTTFGAARAARAADRRR